MVFRQRPASSITEGLFDFEFSRFATPHIVQLAYVLTVVLTGIVSSWILIRGLMAGGLGIVIGLVVAPLLFFATLAYTRIVLEALTAVVGMGQNISAMASRTVTPSADRRTVLQYLHENGRSRADEIAEGTGIPETDLRRMLTPLKNEGRVNEESLGTFAAIGRGSPETRSEHQDGEDQAPNG